MTSRKHDAVFDDVLSDLDGPAAESSRPRAGSRFLKRSTAIGERLAGEREEKVLHWVDPERCRMWERHNRDYALLTEENCRDLIDGIRAQGQQEFPAVVRRLEGEDHDYEVICGARRHFAVSWLRANNYPQFKYLVEVRPLTDEEAFRLADIENRERDDISDYERAKDYAQAIELYYGGKQKAMAERLEVSEAWLSRYLALAELPDRVVAAFPSIRDVKERHARVLKPLLATPRRNTQLMAEAAALASEQHAAREGRGAAVEPAKVVARLKAATDTRRRTRPPEQVYRPEAEGPAVVAKQKGRKVVLEIPEKMPREALEVALRMFLDARGEGAEG